MSRKRKSTNYIEIAVIHDNDPKVFEEELNQKLRDLAGRVIDIAPVTPFSGGFGAYISHFPSIVEIEDKAEVSEVDQERKSRL